MGEATEKMRSRHRGRGRSWVVMMVVVALVLAACGGGDGTADAGADGGSESSSQAAQTSDAGGSETVSDPASDGESCYADQTATLVVSFSAGGGYDQIARTMAPVLEKELGGTVIVENQPGAGGLLALKDLIANEGDPLRFGLFTGQGITGSVLGEAQGADFNLLDLTFIGRIAADQRVLEVGGSSDLQTLEDVQAASGLKFASAGPGANDFVDATVLIPVLDLDAEIITGFDGSAETELALTSGDVELASGTVGSRQSALDSGDHRAVLVLGGKTLEDFPDVPVLLDLDLSEDSAAIAKGYVDLQEMGRMIWAPPGVPDNCVTELQSAVETVLTDPGFIDQMAAGDQEIDFKSGDDMRGIAQGLLDSPEVFASLLKQAYAGG